MSLASCQHSDAQNLELAPEFWENLWIFVPGINLLLSVIMTDIAPLLTKSVRNFTNFELRLFSFAIEYFLPVNKRLV
jgi:hypothetical protein